MRHLDKGREGTMILFLTVGVSFVIEGVGAKNASVFYLFFVTRTTLQVLFSVIKLPVTLHFKTRRVERHNDKQLQGPCLIPYSFNHIYYHELFIITT